MCGHRRGKARMELAWTMVISHWAGGIRDTGDIGIVAGRGRGVTRAGGTADNREQGRREGAALQYWVRINRRGGLVLQERLAEVLGRGLL